MYYGGYVTPLGAQLIPPMINLNLDPVQMTILITGSRTWKDTWKIADRLKQFAETHEGTHKLIHGGAKGADEIAGRWARNNKWDVVVVPANWAVHGNAAGPIRNIQMLDMHPDIVLAFWDGQSKGTKHCIEAARERNIPVDITSK